MKKISAILIFLFTIIIFFKCADDKKPKSDTGNITICSFNIQFLGSFKKRDNQALAEILKEYDIVVVQELVAPPVSGRYPDSTAYLSDPEAKNFFDAMTAYNFNYRLSEEDIGTKDKIHV